MGQRGLNLMGGRYSFIPSSGTAENSSMGGNGGVCTPCWWMPVWMPAVWSPRTCWWGGNCGGACTEI